MVYRVSNMTPRQIIRAISERRNSTSSSLEELVCLPKKFEHPAGCGIDKSTTNNNHESETNNEIITVNKCQDFISISVAAGRSTRVLHKNSMYSTERESTIEVSCKGNGISRDVEPAQPPTRFTDSCKEHPKNSTQGQDTFTATLYSTFKNISEKSTSLKKMHVLQESAMVLPRIKGDCGSQLGVRRPSEVCVENGSIVTGDTAMTDIRGKPKEIHAKVKASGEAKHGKDLTRKGLEKERCDNGVSKGVRERRSTCVVQDPNDDKRLRLHIYIPTADMTG